MKNTVYITSSTEMKREHNLFYWHIGNNFKKTIPIESTSGILIFGEVRLNKRVLKLLALNNVDIQFFSWSWRYAGHLPIPRSKKLANDIGKH